MNFFTITSSFFIIFFSFQFLIGRAGIVSLIQEKYVVSRMTENYHDLVSIQKDLDMQISLAENSKRYLRVYAHRVGLVSDDEIYIHLENSIFNKGNSYSPGTLILFKESFYVSNSILFFISFAIECMLVSLKLYRRRTNMQEKKTLNKTLYDHIDTYANNTYISSLHTTNSQPQKIEHYSK